MHITYLSLTNFRNYGRLELDLSSGATLLYGNNAQGKTNLLEAIYYLATTRSSHADYDYQLINWEADQFDELIVVGRIMAHVMTQHGEQHLEMRLIQEKKAGVKNSPYSFRRQALVNGRKVRLMDLLGQLRVVLFLPEDVHLITGSPSKRRRYIDITLCQIDPIYCRELSLYNKTIEQRNALLRQIAEGTGNKSVLPIFTDKLVKSGVQIFARRARFLKNIARRAQHTHYEALTKGKEQIRLNYLPRLQQQLGRHDDNESIVAKGKWLQEHYSNKEAIQMQYAQAMKEAEHIDLARGSTSIGPHRDDWRFWINNRELSSFGSRGQQRSAILALKLAEIEWMRDITGEKPILLLDEVVAELDEHRRAAVLNAIHQSSQAVLTATDPDMFTAHFLKQADCLYVENGRIIKQSVPSQKALNLQDS